MSNSLDPDQAGHFVGPDLGPNCLQMLSADDNRILVSCKSYFFKYFLKKITNKWLCQIKLCMVQVTLLKEKLGR